ncbi:hypothetical protein D1O30_12410 [Methylocystis hirsuta]|uniref:Uncharacterized protein n=2 Tax=Methylocystis hirsuta TaxID=369798 RepID=A0A3M9XTU2_9HYPH|nr:hypothetical protein D1O30_12410 [Methylocystis hirsuta]
MKLPKLADLGVSKMQSSRWQKLAELSFDDFERRIEATKYDIRRAAEGVEREPHEKTSRKETRQSVSIFKTTKLRNGSALEDIRWSQLNQLIRNNAFELELLRMIRDAGVPPNPNARLRDIISESEVVDFVRLALGKIQ